MTDTPPDPVLDRPIPGPPAPAPFQARTRLVAWAKVLLPLAALALLSTVFLVARAPGGLSPLPFARLSEIARAPRIDEPRLAGVTPEGIRVVVSADRLSPIAGRDDVFTADSPRFEATAPDGREARAEAAAGEVDGPGRTLHLTGGVTLLAWGLDDGETGGAWGPGGALEAQAGSVLADLASGLLTASGGVEAQAPFGRIRSQGMIMLASPGNVAGEGEPASDDAAATALGARMVFNGGVSLLYTPQTTPPVRVPGAPLNAPADASPGARPPAAEPAP